MFSLAFCAELSPSLTQNSSCDKITIPKHIEVILPDTISPDCADVFHRFNQGCFAASFNPLFMEKQDFTSTGFHLESYHICTDRDFFTFMIIKNKNSGETRWATQDGKSYTPNGFLWTEFENEFYRKIEEVSQNIFFHKRKISSETTYFKFYTFDNSSKKYVSLSLEDLQNVQEKTFFGEVDSYINEYLGEEKDEADHAYTIKTNKNNLNKIIIYAPSLKKFLKNTDFIVVEKIGSFIIDKNTTETATGKFRFVLFKSHDEKIFKFGLINEKECNLDSLKEKKLNLFDASKNTSIYQINHAHNILITRVYAEDPKIKKFKPVDIAEIFKKVALTQASKSVDKKTKKR